MADSAVNNSTFLERHSALASDALVKPFECIHKLTKKQQQQQQCFNNCRLFSAAICRNLFSLFTSVCPRASSLSITGLANSRNDFVVVEIALRRTSGSRPVKGMADVGGLLRH